MVLSLQEQKKPLCGYEIAPFECVSDKNSGVECAATGARQGTNWNGKAKPVDRIGSRRKSGYFVTPGHEFIDLVERGQDTPAGQGHRKGVSDPHLLWWPMLQGAGFHVQPK
jgi:hypothetical protein